MNADAFFAADGLFETFLTVLDEFGVFPVVVRRELERYLPFLATTKVLMAAVRAGVGRETAHEVIKEHAVAVALSWLDSAGEELFRPTDQETGKPRKRRKTNEEQIREYLGTLSADALREWLVEAADRDRGIRDKLLFSAKAKTGAGVTPPGPVMKSASMPVVLTPNAIPIRPRTTMPIQ